MSNSEDKPTNGVDSSNMQRLPTFRTPRDLTLGGVKPSKKLFTPNLNVTRNKGKGSSINSANKEPKKDDKNKKDRKKDKNKFVRNGQNVIRSGGVFAEGVGSVERHSSRGFYGRDSDSSNTIQKPTLRPMDFSKIAASKTFNSTEEDIKEEFVDDFKSTKALDAPTKLPMDIGFYPPFAQSKPPFKTPVIVKTEPGLEEDVKVNGFLDLKQEPYEEADAAVDLMRSDKPTLILVKLPYSLPGRGGGDDEPRRKHLNGLATPNDSKEKDIKEAPANERCHLRQLGDGKIGTIRTHRSGRVTLALGDSILDVNSGTTTTFYQELVSIATNDQSRSANMINLGQLQHKMTVSPEWEPIILKKSI